MYKDLISYPVQGYDGMRFSQGYRCSNIENVVLRNEENKGSY